MNRDYLSSLAPPESFVRFDTRNRENVLQARLGIRTSADIYQAVQSDFERARAERSRPSADVSKTPRRVRGSSSRNPPVEDQNSGAIGDRCRGAAGRQPPEGPKSLRPLKTVSRYWGEEKVQHYQWADKGEGYCNKLCSAARAVWDWEEAIVKLNRLILRRAQQLRRRDVKKSVNPIEADDLINLRAWSQEPYVKKSDDEEIALPFSKLAATDLPAGFGFDKFGLLIRMEEQWLGNPPKAGVAGRGSLEESDERQGPRKRHHPVNYDQPLSKRIRTEC